MTNAEKWKEEIRKKVEKQKIEMQKSGGYVSGDEYEFGVYKDGKHFITCLDENCSDCLFCEEGLSASCLLLLIRWLLSENEDVVRI